MLQTITFKSLISPILVLLLGLPVLAKDKAPAKTTEKPRIAVLALEAKNIPAVYADIVRDILEVNLHKQGNFAVLERSQINLIMKEQKTTLNQCSETQCAVDYGKVLSADLVVVGSISRLEQYNIAVKLVDIRESRIIAAEFEQVPSDKELDKAVNSLAGRISRAAMKDTGYVPEPQDDNKHPVFVGVSFRYGWWSNIPAPIVKLPAVYGDPIEIHKNNFDYNVLSIALTPTYGLNRFISLKSNIHGTIRAYDKKDFILESNTVTAIDANNNISIYSTYSPNSLTGFGIDALMQANYPLQKFIPFIAGGCGYSYYKRRDDHIGFFLDRITMPSNASDYIYGQLYYSNNIHLFYLTAEAGFTLLFMGSTGLSISFICNYPVGQTLFSNMKYQEIWADKGNSLLPPAYQTLTTSSFKQRTGSMDLPPIYYIQAGFVFRFK